MPGRFKVVFTMQGAIQVLGFFSRLTRSIKRCSMPVCPSICLSRVCPDSRIKSCRKFKFDAIWYTGFSWRMYTLILFWGQKSKVKITKLRHEIGHDLWTDGEPTVFNGNVVHTRKKPIQQRSRCTSKTAKIHRFVRFIMYCSITTLPVASCYDDLWIR